MSAICVADIAGGVGVSRGTWATTLSTEGNAALLIVNLDQVRSLAQLSSALAAVQGYASTTYFRSGETRRRHQSDRGPGIQAIGPFVPPSSPQPNPRIVAFSYRSGWTAALVAGTMRTYNMGTIGGPHAVAMVIDHEKPGSDAALAALSAGAVLGLTGTLS
jgi:hypothetical protein